MENDEKELLINSLKFRKPLLFLGAGFSANAMNDGQCILLGENLKNELFKEFYEFNCVSGITENDKDEIKTYDLPKLCKAIQNDGRSKQLNNFLIKQFKNIIPNEKDPYHNLLCDYYWEKIYSLNIDDLIENIFLANNIEFVVQNERICKIYGDKRQIIKLHGCVNNPDEGFIFSSDEYAVNIAREDYRLKQFCDDYFKNDIIFLGTEFNETDIAVILEKNRKSGFVENQCNYFFVSPKIGYNLRNVINANENYHHIKLNSKEFLELCSELNQKEKTVDIQERILEQGGFLKLSKYDNIPDGYESKLYYGNKVNFYDIFTNWDVENSKTDIVLKNILKNGDSGAYIIAIYGKAFSGKTVIATRLLVELYRNGYEAYSYDCDGEDELNQLNEYLSQNNGLRRVAVLIDDAAYLYGAIVKFVERLPKHIKSIVFILESDKNKHESQKHELVGTNGREWCISDQFDDKIPRHIYKKLEEKNRLGGLKVFKNDKVAISKIAEAKSITEFFYRHTRGQGFRSYFEKKLKDFLRTASHENIEVFKAMCIFTKLGIHNVNKSLLMLVSSSIQKEQFGDLLVGFEMSGGISLRCAAVYDNYLFSMSSKDRMEFVFNVLTAIANMFREETNNRWKTSFELLLKTRSLHKDLKIENKDIAQLFAKLEKYYRNVSYFWLQRGLLKQSMGEYEDSKNFLNQALSIRPNSYQIRHAIAKNDIEQAIDKLLREKDNEAINLYECGADSLIELIESPRFSNNMGHSVHTYITTTLRYYKAIRKIISDDLIEKMHLYLVQASKQSYDNWMANCRKDLYAYCSQYVPKLKSKFDAQDFNNYRKFNYIRKI